MGITNDVMTAPLWEEELGKSGSYKAIKDAASLHNIDQKEFMQLAQIESGFKTTVESPTGYRGLFQLDPSNYRGSPPFNPPSLFDAKTNAEFAAKEYKDFGGDFLNKVIRWNQGKKGGQQILNAHSVGGSIRAHSKEPWNRTKKILNNLSDKSLNIIADKYKIKGDRNQLINVMIDKKLNTFRNLSDDPLLVNLYVDEQKGKVESSGKEVDRILKEI